MDMNSKEETTTLFEDDENVDDVVYQQSRQMNVFLTETHWCKIILAFVVTIFCCPILGTIAFGLAGTAEGIKYQNGLRARRLAKSSLYVSVAGIVIGVLIMIAVIVLYIWLWDVWQQQLKMLLQYQQQQSQLPPNGY